VGRDESFPLNNVGLQCASCASFFLGISMYRRDRVRANYPRRGKISDWAWEDDEKVGRERARYPVPAKGRKGAAALGRNPASSG
jgi:hypothetical protein